jgi:recombination protein RecT
MYRAGAVSSVIVEVVRENDGFVLRPGYPPDHTYNPFADVKDRGNIIGAYAYAVMKDGAISKVVTVNTERIVRAKTASGVKEDDNYSPWRNDPAAMWMKTAVRDLAKWVPTSAEYRRVFESDELEAPAGTVVNLPQLPSAVTQDQTEADTITVDATTGEVLS